MAGDPAELAYGHALAMLGDPGAATEVAALALRRAGRARTQVLAHARAEAVARAAQDEPVDIDTLQTLVLDLPALAATLASTRPPQERAALDVRARTAGDLAALGRHDGALRRDAPEPNLRGRQWLAKPIQHRAGRFIGLWRKVREFWSGERRGRCVCICLARAVLASDASSFCIGLLSVLRVRSH